MNDEEAKIVKKIIEDTINEFKKQLSNQVRAMKITYVRNIGYIQVNELLNMIRVKGGLTNG